MYLKRLKIKPDIKIKLSSIKTDIKEICKNVEQCQYPDFWKTYFSQNYVLYIHTNGLTIIFKQKIFKCYSFNF